MIADAAGRGVGEGRVVGHQAEVVVGDLDLAKVHRADRAVRDRQLVGLAGAVVGDGERLLAAVYLPVGRRVGLGLGAHVRAPLRSSSRSFYPIVPGADLGLGACALALPPAAAEQPAEAPGLRVRLVLGRARLVRRQRGGLVRVDRQRHADAR